MSFLGSEINLKLNKAICMVYDDKIIAEAYSIAGKRCIEIGTIVHENYRQMGLASFICSELIKRVTKDNNVEIFWTCDKSNTASVKTAKKIGFTMVQEYLCYAC
jgi:RimJ/RimL family protein N-acetyltransferase